VLIITAVIPCFGPKTAHLSDKFYNYFGGYICFLEAGAMKFEPGRLIKAVFLWQLFCLITPLYAATPWLHTDGNKIKDPQGNVVVLRGVDLIDLGFLEEWHGGAIEMLDRLTDLNDSQGNYTGWYPRVIRINVTPSDAASGWPHPFRPDNNDFYDNLLRPVVDYCAAKDMYAIVDWHYVANTYDHVASTSAFWNYMAPRFADDSHVIFELFNEPINTSVGDDTQDWLSVRNDMQTWIDIVRTYAPKNLILVAGPSWSQVIGPVAASPLTGDNIVIVSHIYPGHWLTNPAGDNWYTNHINTCLTRYPVFMSEWGFTSDVNYDDDWHGLMGTITNYGQPLMDFREARQISNSAWVASYNWGPPMFYPDWSLRIGEGEMGGFVKDKLYVTKDDDLPAGGDSIAPDAPSGFTATSRDYGIVPLNWDDNAESDIYVYNIYRSTVSGEFGRRLNNEYLRDSNFIDNNVVPGITYYYVVTAIDTSLNESANSTEVSAVPQGGVIYNFSGVTQSTPDYNAFACDVDQFPFGGNSTYRNTIVEATDAQYSNISTINSKEWATGNPGSADEVFLWVEMKINESAANIEKIDLTFDGNTGGAFSTSHRIYALKAGADWTLDASWVQIGAGQDIFPGSYTTMTRSITADINDYIDDANGRIVWGVYETTSWQAMHVNFLGMVVYGEGCVNPQPTVYISSPSNDATFAMDSNIPISAYASDADGNVTLVEFYEAANKLGEDSVAPFTCTWNGVSTGEYKLTAKVIDDDDNITTSPEVNIMVLGDLGTGMVLRELWTGISGTSVSNLTSDVNFPNNPKGRVLITALEGPTNWADNYGTRIRGYLHPVVDGDYTFWIASDDDSELWLSTDAQPANAVKIAYVSGTTNPREWTKYASQQSTSITLTAGGKYYIEVLHKAGGANDNIAVAWGDDPNQKVIDAMYLSPFGLKLTDYAGFASQWKRDDCDVANGRCNGADFSRDGSVLIDDLKAFAESWLEGI